MSKTNKILLGLLAAQLLLAGYLYRETGQNGSPEVMLLADLAADQVRKLVISETEEQQVTLLRSDEGWQVELAPGRNYPADATKIEALLGRLAGLKSTRLVSRTTAAQQRLKVAAEQYNRRLVLHGGSGSHTLFLGTSPSYQTIHARPAGKDEVYQVRDLALWEVPAEAAGWWQARYLDQDPKQLLAVDLVNQQGSLRLARTTPEAPWTLAGGQGETDAAQVEEFVAAISRVSINGLEADPAWQPTGSPAATLKLRSASGEVELRVWPRAEENGDYPVKVADSSFYGWSGNYVLERLLRIEARELLPGGPEGS